ncbi:hypothetical protein B0T13DRAFT_522045 [Neurospora crassa]|nr:hypothetical protein B0T13DRAFT_522045 [Neurospora crassa]
MSLIYGEGENAFVRLQHELIRKYDDESIFVWDGNIGVGRSKPGKSLSPTTLGMQSQIPQAIELELDPASHTSILAPSLRNFMSTTQLGLTIYRHDKTPFRFEMTKSGISINAELYRNTHFYIFPAYMIPLNCSYVHQNVKPGFPRRVSSPMVLLLSEAYPEKSEMFNYLDGPTTSHGSRIPTTFRKIRHGPMNWQELDPAKTQWFSLGRQNIIILNEHEVDDSDGIASLDTFYHAKFVFEPTCKNQPVHYSITGYRKVS